MHAAEDRATITKGNKREYLVYRAGASYRDMQL